MQYHQRKGAQNGQVRKKRVFTPTEEEPASPQYTGHYAGLHDEDTPHVTTSDVRARLAPKQTRPAYEPDEYEAGEHMTTIARRYNGIPMPDGVMYRQGNDQVYLHTTPIQRASRTQVQIPAPKKTDETLVRAKKPRRQFHWLFFVGLALVAMLIGFVALNAFAAWWHIHSDDSTYGRPRTFQIDAVVGHRDSETHPSHFIAINLNRHVVIIEIPGGDVSRSVIYSGGELLGDGQDLTPVTLSFSDVNGDGRVDMIVHILDQTIIFLNNGTKFVPPSNLVTGESNLPIRGE